MPFGRGDVRRYTGLGRWEVYLIAFSGVVLLSGTFLPRLYLGWLI